VIARIRKRVGKEESDVSGREQDPSTAFLGDPQSRGPRRGLPARCRLAHNPDQDVRGIEEAKQFVSTFIQAFPDLNFSVEDLIAEGDKVVSRVRGRGTHQGETEEFGPPTGRQFEQEGITIHRIEDGKIVEEWNQWDNLSILQQLGIAPEQ
jgi:steroid delta-isomerase-like uncharacterized protein